MIRLVKGMNLDGQKGLLGQMFEARKRLFLDRLQWDVTIDDRGWEVDQYDQINPLYLISTNKDGAHQGSLRLLPTTGDTMLRDVFAPVFDDTVIESPLIWEVSEAYAAKIREAGQFEGSILEPASRRRAARLLNAA